MALAAAGIVSRLAYLQIAEHSSYRSAATAEHFDRAIVPAHRGNLLDATGHPLATSVGTYDIAVDRAIW